MSVIVQHIIRQYDFNMLYAEALVVDLDETQMTMVPTAGLLNHPAFTLGHLVTGSAMIAEDLGAPVEMPEGWDILFQRKGPNDQSRPDTDASRYPSKQSLLNELYHQHEKVKRYLWAVDASKLQEPVKWRFSTHMPTLLDVIMFMCISHENMHLGQLAAWRRALNLSPALMTL